MVGDGTYMTTGEAAAALKISRWKLVQLIESGDLPAATVPHSKHRRILATDVEKLRQAIYGTG